MVNKVFSDEVCNKISSKILKRNSDFILNNMNKIIHYELKHILYYSIKLDIALISYFIYKEIGRKI